MTERRMLFDASSVLTLVREIRGKAPDMFRGGSTISLAYYEIGNALWRECFLLKRIVPREAAILLRSIFEMLQRMDVAVLEDEDSGEVILDTAGELKVTYYDAAYLAEAQRANKVLVTDDEGLAEAAKDIGVETLTSKTIRQQPRP